MLRIIFRCVGTMETQDGGATNEQRGNKARLKWLLGERKKKYTS
jgi:hypothetical protein